MAYPKNFEFQGNALVMGGACSSCGQSVVRLWKDESLLCTTLTWSKVTSIQSWNNLVRNRPISLKAGLMWDVWEFWRSWIRSWINTCWIFQLLINFSRLSWVCEYFYHFAGSYINLVNLVSSTSSTSLTGWDMCWYPFIGCQIPETSKRDLGGKLTDLSSSRPNNVITKVASTTKEEFFL